jgi:hypothetical protein
MRAILAILSLAIINTAAARDKPIKLLIAPRSAKLPPSRKLVFDIYWHNWTDKPQAIPSLDTYSTLCWAIVPGRDGGEMRGSGSVLDHPAADRRIGPHAVIHDTITAEVELNRGEIGQFSLRVSGEHHQHFESNTVVFTRR